MYRRFINWFSTTMVGRWIAIQLAARLDPVLYKLTGGKLTTVGPQVIPQLVLTSIGRKSGRKRSVQLGFTEDGLDYLIVASNFGGKNHPGWSYNLEANPNAQIQIGAATRDVIATRLPDEEKEALWPRIAATIPQMKSYRVRTDRNIKVYRLRAT
ncbi:MAG: nitroreductase family deazaflavin-dependent oxidoreductase [Myxococcales bacterium]|nr:nitroreductase family deazaflavin-dependent oxidoreductase [Myxococcales bacterium]MDH3486361.1 nitroreductase family deazaflavin-dependent oxidoreductase [Myxococcales bacterium]